MEVKLEESDDKPLDFSKAASPSALLRHTQDRELRELGMTLKTKGKRSHELERAV
jgi:hypothetical protein